MDIASALLSIAGVLLIATALYDALRTTIAVGGGGPLTMWLAHGFWKGALRWHRRQGAERPEGSSHGLLARMGPLILLGVIITWIVLLGAGYLLLYSAAPETVVNAKTDAPADFWERLYFTGFTVSTLGVGDYIPKGAGARALTVFASLSGLFVMTLSITYLIPVVSAVVEKRQLAASIAGLGETPQDILHVGWDGESLSSLEQPLVNLADRIELHAQRHLAYPVLHFFHSAESRQAIGPRVAALSEALRLIGQMPREAQPPPAAPRAVRSAIDGFLRTLRSSFVPQHKERQLPDADGAETLRRLGLPVSDGRKERRGLGAGEQKGIEEQERRRYLLRMFVEYCGWRWTDVTD
jgi:hypothetical protein